MLRTWFKDLQIEHKKTKIYTYRIFNFTFIIEIWAKMSLSKLKSHYLDTTVQMVGWLRSVPYILRARASSKLFHWKLILRTFVYMFLNYICRVFTYICRVFCDLRWKLWQNNTEVSFRRSRSVYTTANSTAHSTLTILKPDNQWLCYATKEHYFLSADIGIHLWKRQNLSFIFHILILVLCMCTATYNANTNSYRQTSNLLRMQLVYLWKSGKKNKFSGNS